jgi:hypothetical protein
MDRQSTKIAFCLIDLKKTVAFNAPNPRGILFCLQILSQLQQSLQQNPAGNLSLANASRLTHTF